MVFISKLKKGFPAMSLELPDKVQCCVKNVCKVSRFCECVTVLF